MGSPTALPAHPSGFWGGCFWVLSPRAPSSAFSCLLMPCALPAGTGDVPELLPGAAPGTPGPAGPPQLLAIREVRSGRALCQLLGTGGGRL